ncbi:MAG: molybdenum cofactor biosynthesis protein MoaE [Ornithinimicrobium sp.]
MTQTAESTWVGVQSEPLSLDAALDVVGDPRAGAVAIFIGTVREHDGGRDGVTQLDYSAHPQAAEALREVADVVAAQPGVCGVVALHRQGQLAVGDRAVICVVSAEHRAQAFDGARQLIEECKARVPIWKRQHFTGEDPAWVGL